MTNHNNRKILSRYQIGNMLFKLLCMGFGAFTFLYLAFAVQFFYETVPVRGTYYLFLTGGILLIWGMLFAFFKRLGRLVTFSTFVYLGLGLFLLLYLGGIFIHAYPSTAVYIFGPVYLALGILLFMFLSLWKREGGVRVFFYFFLGVLFSGFFNRAYSVEPLYIIYSVKIVFALFVLFIVSYALGLFGIFKERKLAVFVATAAAAVVIFYPLNLGVLINELDRYKWERTTQLLGQDYDYVDTYQTQSRKIDVFISNDDKEQSYAFVENGIPIVYNYPLKEEQELNFYFSLTQQREPMKSVLVVGDIPVGLINVLNKLPENVEIHYMPVDRLYPAFWADLIHDQSLNRVKIITERSSLLYDYNIIYLFPPNIRGVGAFSYINSKQFGMLRKHVTVGSLIVVTSKLFPIGVENVVRNNLEGLFKNISFVKLSSDLNFIIASDEQGNVTANPSTLKYRFLELGINGDYSRVRSYFDNSKAVVSNYFGVMDDASSDKSLLNKKFLMISIAAGILLFIMMYYVLTFRIHPVSKWVHSVNTVVLFSVLGSVFGSIVLYHQSMFVDIHTTFTSLFTMFVLGITAGVAGGWFMARRMKMGKVFLWGLGIFFVMMVSWLLMMNYLYDPRLLVIYLVWAGASSLVMMGTVYWYRFFVSLENMFRLLSLIFLGLGTGIMLSGLFDMYGVSISVVNGAVSAWGMLFMIYNMQVLKGKKL